MFLIILTWATGFLFLPLTSQIYALCFNFCFIYLLQLLLVKQTREKKPRESILRSEFANAIEFINRDLSEENRLKFIHWDLHTLSKKY